MRLYRTSARPASLPRRMGSSERRDGSGINSALRSLAGVARGRSCSSGSFGDRVLERLNQFVQNAFDGDLDAPPFGNQRRAEGMFKKFLERPFQSAGKRFNRAQLPMQI